MAGANDKKRTLKKRVQKLRADLADAEKELSEFARATGEHVVVVDDPGVDPTVHLTEQPVLPRRSTVFSYLSVDALPYKRLPRGLLLAAESLIYVGISVFIARNLG